MISSEEIKIISDNLKSFLYLKKIILFGSHVYGSATIESDVDLCVITNSDRRKIEITREIRSALIPFINKALDILVYGEKEFAERSSAKGALEFEIKNKGLVLYE